MMLAQSDMSNDLREVFDTAEPQQHVDLRRRSARARGRSSTTSTQSVRPAAATPNSLAARPSTRCTSLADNTDGRAIVNRNDLADGMKQIMRDASGYYLLGYNSAPAPTDGKFHEIKVRGEAAGRARCARARATGPTRPRTPPEPTRRAPDAPPPVTAALARPRRSAAWTSGALLDRHRARRERADEGHVRVGADSAPPASSGARRRGVRVTLTALAPRRPLFRGRVPEQGAAPRRRPPRRPRSGAAIAPSRCRRVGSSCA